MNHINKFLILFLLTIFILSCNNKDKNKVGNDYDRESHLISFLDKKDIGINMQDYITSILINRQTCDCGDPVDSKKTDRFDEINKEYLPDNKIILYEIKDTKNIKHNFENADKYYYIFDDSESLDKAGIRKISYIFVIKNKKIIYWEAIR
ncbi:MAG: hypothetical protein LBQ22_05330 [Bacteroidales bacterium]|jgi:hypothetical protein|nr:hypothetical protein [Bacteroidales bacterium]